MSQVNPRGATPPTDDRIQGSAPHFENESSDQIKQRIDRTRGAMDETLDELGQRLSPRHLLDDVIDMFRSPKTQDKARQAGGAVNEFAHNLGRQVRDNPVPSLLIGAGLAWLALASHHEAEEEPEAGWPAGSTRRRPSPQDYESQGYIAGLDADYDDQDDDGLYPDEEFGVRQDFASSSTIAQGDAPEGHVGDSGEGTRDGESLTQKASRASSATKEAIADAASGVGSALSSAGEATSDAARRGYRSTRRGAKSAYRGAASGGRRAGRSARRAYHTAADQLVDAYEATTAKFHEAHREYPLGVGFGFLALGALAGLAIPRTRSEDQWMGETSDQWTEDAWQAGEQAVRHGQEAVRETVETAKTSAQKHGLTPESLAERASHVVDETVTSATEAAQEQADDATPETKTKTAHVDPDTKKFTGADPSA